MDKMIKIKNLKPMDEIHSKNGDLLKIISLKKDRLTYYNYSNGMQKSIKIDINDYVFLY